MIFFVLAFLTECFYHSGTVPLVPVSVAALTVLVLVVWSSHTLGDWNLSDEWGHLSGSVLTATKWIKDVRKRIPAAVRSISPRAREFGGGLPA